jgi:hypothetical protein
MAYDLQRVRGLNVLARDGEIGSIDDLYFEDDAWAVRYLVVDTGGWLTGRKVLVSPHAVQRVTAEEGRIEIDLTRRQIEDSPGLDTDKPVSRQFETSYYDYYDYPFYWTGPYLWGMAPYPYPRDLVHEAPAEVEERKARERERGDPHLRSAKEVAGYHVEASDGAIGHVETFLVDDRTWQIQSIVIDTRNWLPGRHVSIDPSIVDRVDWPQRQVYVRATRDAVESAPAYQGDSATT